MNRLLYISSIALLCAATAQGQTITQRLKSRVAGQGVVNVYQSDSVSAVVNGKPAKQPSAPATAPAKAAQKATPASEKPREENKSRQEEPATALVAPVVPQEATDSMATLSRTALRGGHKMSGYRVQAYAGGNSRANRRQAENTRTRVKQLLPLEPVYVHFLSPRWVCRVGNYRTYAEAQQVLHQLRDELGIQGANIVKCQIIVKEEP